MEYFDPLAPRLWIIVCVAILCGVVVGLERQLRGKPMGVRTSCLICLGTALYVHLGIALANEQSDTTRVLGQVVTGVGFLGAGVILSRGGKLTGVTTAAVIWVLAGIGAAIGSGYVLGPLALALVTVAILTGVELLETTVRRLSGGVYDRTQGPGQD